MATERSDRWLEAIQERRRLALEVREVALAELNIDDATQIVREIVEAVFPAASEEPPAFLPKAIVSVLRAYGLHPLAADDYQLDEARRRLAECEREAAE